MTNVFDFNDYKKYLNSWLKERHRQGQKGLRSRLAEALSCQSAYVSRVLNADAHFNLDQADMINQFCNHSVAESEFLFLLVQWARAGTPSLRKYFVTKIEHERNLRLNLKERLAVKNTISKSDEALYFSRWQNAAVHVALLVPALQDKDSLASRLGIPVTQVIEIIEFLRTLGLVADGGQNDYSPGTNRLHLGKDSPMLPRHHSNWRLRAIDTIEKNLNAGLHYSSVVSIAKSDVDRIKEIIIQGIEAANAVIKDSPEETLASLCVDFYEF